MTDALDPACLTPAASLNRVRIADLPGVALPDEVRGRTAYELLAAAALAEQVRQQAGALYLRDARDAGTATLLRHLDGCLDSEDPDIRATATALAGRFGAAVGYLLLALRRGDAANRHARPDWDDSYWAHWASVTTVVLGGGMLSGWLGPPVVAHAARTLRQAGMTDCAVRRAAWPALLPLVGAARTVPPACRSMLTFDFGQRCVKRACATYTDGTLTELRLSPYLPVRDITAAIGADPTSAQVAGLGEELVSTLAATWQLAQAAGRQPDPVCTVSIASYVRDGQPLPRQGGPYAALHRLSPNLADWLAGRLSVALGRPFAVRLLHDGTAAAHPQAGAAHAAVIMLGTALGVGFPPGAHGLRPVAPSLVVSAD
ncbi:MAG: hypothetical protein ACTHMR_20525 [Thermomicrobiales bacterium]